MTAPLIMTVVLAIGVLCAHLSHTVALLVLIRSALRDSTPKDREKILRELAPALRAIGYRNAAENVRPPIDTQRAIN